MTSPTPQSCLPRRRRRLAATRAAPFLVTALAFLTAPDLTPARGLAADPPAPALPEWLARPLALPDALNVALQQNSAVLKARSDLEAAAGIVIQTRAIAIPKLRAFGEYRWSDQIEDLELQIPGLPGQSVSFQNENQWSAGIQLVQSVFEGGRIRSAFRTARLTREQAEHQYQVTVSDTVLQVRSAYADVLLARQQIEVQQESLALLGEELKNTQRRHDAGTVPRFNVLRAEVEVANARPALIRAQNAHRTAKNQLVNLLGADLPPTIWEDVPLQLSGTLDPQPLPLDLPAALALARERRPELAALRQAIDLSREAVVAAKSGYYPSLQVFAGHGWRNASFRDELDSEVSGWNAGAQLNWNLFDGLHTRGKIREAKARQRGAELDLEDVNRRIELEVRTAFSSVTEAREVLESQKKVQEQALEAVRLATVRAEAGAGIQLDVLSANTALTQARTTEILARHDYVVALARLEHAVGVSRP